MSLLQQKVLFTKMELPSYRATKRCYRNFYEVRTLRGPPK
jgi:hypothetical protein